MEQIYQQMWEANLPRIKRGDIYIDPDITNSLDRRRGLTLLIRFEQPVQLAMQSFLEKAKEIVPNQYAYPTTDLHLTTLSVFSCQENFTTNQIKLSEYKNLIINTLPTFHSFNITFKGITLSPSGIVAKGYDSSGTLNQVRDAIRVAFKQSGLAHTIDKRYVLQVAHTTLLRFKAPLQATDDFVNFVKQHQDFSFGVTKVNQVDLVFNDWYMKKENVEVLASYPLLKHLSKH